MTASPFFTKLPVEIRDKIYYHAFTSDTIEIYTNSPWTNNNPALIPRFSYRKPSFIEACKVNRQFFWEAYMVILQCGTFKVTANIHKTPPNESNGREETNPVLTIADKHMRILENITNLQIHVVGPERGLRFDRTMIDVTPVAETLPRLAKLKRVLVYPANDLGCLFCSRTDTELSYTARPKKLFGPFEELQRLNSTVQVTVQLFGTCFLHQYIPLF
ncbi:hypothetical protein ACLMJK_008623 [Lecanora helva]